METAKRDDQISRIISSMGANAVEKYDENGYIYFECLKYESVTGRIKDLAVSRVFTEQQMKMV